MFLAKKQYNEKCGAKQVKVGQLFPVKTSGAKIHHHHQQQQHLDDHRRHHDHEEDDDDDHHDHLLA